MDLEHDQAVLLQEPAAALRNKRSTAVIAGRRIFRRKSRVRAAARRSQVPSTPST